MAKLEAGEDAPDFEAQDGDGETWRLSDLRGKKVILYFYPADDTPGCTREACDFRDSQSDFTDAGYVVLGASPQGADSHSAFSSKYGLNFPLLVDEDMGLAKAYGTAGIFGKFENLPLTVQRSTFVIDERGKIEQALYGVSSRSHVEELKASLT
ncbi:MAG: peroxiredoxin [Actinomycetota bacterium]